MAKFDQNNAGSTAALLSQPLISWVTNVKGFLQSNFGRFTVRSHPYGVLFSLVQRNEYSFKVMMTHLHEIYGFKLSAFVNLAKDINFRKMLDS